MFKKVCLAVLAVAGLYGYASAAAANDFTKSEKVKAWKFKMVQDHGFKPDLLDAWMAAAEKKQPILDAIARPAEKTKPWHDYRNIFLGQTRIDQGVAFWQENKTALESAQEKYGVDPAIIVAIIGVETRYGRYMGSYRVIDALSTLGFAYPPRAKFFLKELEHYLLLAREQQKDPLTLKGSYAGAMGYGQFIPSSYRRYARDGDGDGFIDIWENKTDAIASVANYFKAHGWQAGKPVAVQAIRTSSADKEILNSRKRPKLTLSELEGLGYKVELTSDSTVDSKALAVPHSFRQIDRTDYLLGFNNFYVITRYNHSKLYARAVWELSQEIERAYTGL